MARTDVAAEGVRDWAIWGARAFLAPAAYYLFVLIVLGIAVVFYRLVKRVFPFVSGIERSLAGRIAAAGLDVPDHLACVTLVAGTLLVAGACWRFAGLLDALIIYPDVSSAPAAQQQLLSPAFKGEHVAYRELWMWIVLACAVLWYAPVAVAGRRQQPLNPLLLAGGGAVTLVALLLFTFPYRMLSQNNDLEIATFHGARCYVLGERGNDLRLFCPQRDPRSQAASRTDPNLQRTGTFESPFALFSPSPE
jgi:hypothetical protein